MRKSFLLMFALCSLPLFAQKSGGITDSMLEQIRKGYSDTPSEKAVRNALAGLLSLNWLSMPITWP